jgi:hypothetical protein
MVITVNKLERNVMEKLAAIIVEDRYFEDTIQICKEHLSMLPDDTDLILYSTQENIEKYKEDATKQNLKIAFKLYDQNVKIPIGIKYIGGMESVLKDQRMSALLNYCLFVTRPEFWMELFDYDRVLTFQRDTKLLKKGIDAFYEYDYVGAPCYNFVKDQTIQNGGLSLRNPKTMEYVCRVYGWSKDVQDLLVVGQYSSAWFFAEDIFFCLRMIKHNAGALAPLEVSKRFSCESRFEYGTLGYHAIDRYMPEEAVKLINEQYNY